MPIRPGTLCYLTGDHAKAGQCCTVVGELEEMRVADIRNLDLGSWIDLGYPIALASGEPPPIYAICWSAAPYHLIPIAPPGLTERESKSEPVAA